MGLMFTVVRMKEEKYLFKLPHFNIEHLNTGSNLRKRGSVPSICIYIALTAWGRGTSHLKLIQELWSNIKSHEVIMHVKVTDSYKKNLLLLRKNEHWNFNELLLTIINGNGSATIGTSGLWGAYLPHRVVSDARWLLCC